MATQSGVLIQDQNLKVYFDGKQTNVYKAQKKQAIGGRKALGDLTNSGEPSLIKTSKRHGSKKKICAREGSKKNHKNVKLSSVMEEVFLPNSIAKEQFLHNHEECIEAQSMDMSMDYFLETIGLHNDFPMQLPSCHVPPASSGKPKIQPESPTNLELQEITELMIEEIGLPGEYKSPSCFSKTPKSSNPNAGPDYFVGVLQIEPNFTTIETPVLPKH